MKAAELAKPKIHKAGRTKIERISAKREVSKLKVKKSEGSISRSKVFFFLVRI